ncbi:MAG: hypothetical protein ACFFEF_17015 [Candidatus Thorarchaeota archaeon]
MIELVGFIIAFVIVITMGGMCFDWIGSGMVNPIYQEGQEPKHLTEDK